MDIYCGLDAKPSAKVAPEEEIEEKTEESGAPSEETVQSDTPEGTKPREALESPLWSKVANVSGLLLLLITVLCHVLYH